MTSKTTCLFSLFALLGLPHVGAAQGHASAQVELHNSTASFSPAADIQGSSLSVVAVQPDSAQTLGKLDLELKSPEPRQRLHAINDLTSLGPKAKPDLVALVQVLTDRSTGLEAARAIHKIDPAYPIPPFILTRLVRRAKAPPERERVHTAWITRCDSQSEALDTLAALGPSAHSVIPDLVRLTHRFCVHEHVVAALDKIGSPDEAQMAQIASGLQDKDLEARQAAIEYLAKSQPTTETIRTLGRAMNDPNSGVRLSALQALEEIHPEGEGRLPLLAGYLKDASPDIRERALYMVGQLGPDARTAIPLLHEALKDPEPAIALTAAKLLSKVDAQDNTLITALIGFMHTKNSAQALQAADILEWMGVHDARVDAALEPYRTQQALWHRISSAQSNIPPEQLAENARTLKVNQVRVASSIIQDEPVHVSRNFPANVGRVYCWTEVSISTPPAAIIHRWYRNGRLQHEEYFEVTTSPMHLWSSAAARSGDWKVELLPSGANEPMATAVFTVAKRKP